MNVEEDKKRTWISDMVLDAAITLERSFTPEEACIYVADKMNTKPNKVKSRVMLGIKRGRKEGTLKPRGKNKYSLAGDSEESLMYSELEEKCGKRKKRKKSCFKAKKRRRSSCKKKVRRRKSCKKKKRKRAPCKPKRRRRKSKCAKKRKPSKSMCDLCKKKKRRRRRKPKKEKCDGENKNGTEGGENPPANQSALSVEKRQIGGPTQRPPSPSTKNQPTEAIQI